MGKDAPPTLSSIVIAHHALAISEGVDAWAETLVSIELAEKDPKSLLPRRKRPPSSRGARARLRDRPARDPRDGRGARGDDGRGTRGAPLVPVAVTVETRGDRGDARKPPRHRRRTPQGGQLGDPPGREDRGRGARRRATRGGELVRRPGRAARRAHDQGQERSVPHRRDRRRRRRSAGAAPRRRRSYGDPSTARRETQIISPSRRTRAAIGSRPPSRRSSSRAPSRRSSARYSRSSAATDWSPRCPRTS
jgi:hypothetical protein